MSQMHGKPPQTIYTSLPCVAGPGGWPSGPGGRRSPSWVGPSAIGHRTMVHHGPMTVVAWAVVTKSVVFISELFANFAVVAHRPSAFETWSRLGDGSFRCVEQQEQGSALMRVAVARPANAHCGALDLPLKVWVLDGTRDTSSILADRLCVGPIKLCTGENRAHRFVAETSREVSLTLWMPTTPPDRGIFIDYCHRPHLDAKTRNTRIHGAPLVATMHSGLVVAELTLHADTLRRRLASASSPLA